MKLAEIRALIEAATPGPWCFDNGNDEVEGGGRENRWTVCGLDRGGRFGVNVDGESNVNPYDFRDDAEFIAASRALLPLLCELWEACLPLDDATFNGWAADDVRQVLAKLEAADASGDSNHQSSSESKP